MESQIDREQGTQRQRGQKQDQRGSMGSFSLCPLKFGGPSNAARPPHKGTGPGGLSHGPSLLGGRCGFPTRTSHTCSAEASRSVAGRWCIGPASTGSWGESQEHVPSVPGPAHFPHPPPRHSHLRFLVDNVKEVHDHGQVIDGHGRVHRRLCKQSTRQRGPGTEWPCLGVA